MHPRHVSTIAFSLLATLQVVNVVLVPFTHLLYILSTKFAVVSLKRLAGLNSDESESLFCKLFWIMVPWRLWMKVFLLFLIWVRVGLVQTSTVCIFRQQITVTQICDSLHLFGIVAYGVKCSLALASAKFGLWQNKLFFFYYYYFNFIF